MSESTDDRRAESHRAQIVKRAHEEELMGKANVVGVGVGFIQREGRNAGRVGVIVMVSRKLAESELPPDDCIPTELEGVPVDVQEVGTIRADSQT